MRPIDADHLTRWILSRAFRMDLSVADVIDQIAREDTIVTCKDCKFYTPMNCKTKTGICCLLMHQNFGDDWYCAGAERRTDEAKNEPNY